MSDDEEQVSIESISPSAAAALDALSTALSSLLSAALIKDSTHNRRFLSLSDRSQTTSAIRASFAREEYVHWRNNLPPLLQGVQTCTDNLNKEKRKLEDIEDTSEGEVVFDVIEESEDQADNAILAATALISVAEGALSLEQEELSRIPHGNPLRSTEVALNALTPYVEKMNKNNALITKSCSKTYYNALQEGFTQKESLAGIAHEQNVHILETMVEPVEQARKLWKHGERCWTALVKHVEEVGISEVEGRELRKLGRSNLDVVECWEKSIVKAAKGLLKSLEQEEE